MPHLIRCGVNLAPVRKREAPYSSPRGPHLYFWPDIQLYVSGILASLFHHLDSLSAGLKQFEAMHLTISDYLKGGKQMFPNYRGNSLVVISLLVSLTGCLSREHVVRPPTPDVRPPMQNPLIPVTDSTISMPVRIDLSSFLDQANDENVVPRKFDSWGAYIKGPKGVDYKYYAERDDFAITPSGSMSSVSATQGTAPRDWWKGIELPGSYISISSALRYKMGAQPHMLCGDGSEWPKRGRLQGNIAMGITPNYGLSASVNGVMVYTADACNMRINDFDVTQEVKHRLAESVRGGLSNAVARIHRITLRPELEEVWNALRTPIPIEPGAWLLLNVDKIRHSGFSGDGHSVDDTIQFIANPVMVSGDEPSSISTALPPLDTQPTSAGFHVVADAQLDYAELSKMLTSRLKGQRLQQDRDIVTIANAWIYGNGGNQVILRIDIAGDVNGYVYLVGKPEINSLTQAVHIGDLQYDRATANVIRTTARWLFRTSLRELVASEAVLGVTPAIDRVRDRLAKAVNRAVTPTVSIRGIVESVQAIGVFADVKALHVRTMSNGTLSVTLASKP